MTDRKQPKTNKYFLCLLPDFKKTCHVFPKSVLLFISMCFISVSSYSQNTRTNLLHGFENPPNEARPRVWWHWTDGNISKEGIRKDLLWMHRIGIGGFHVFDVQTSSPLIVEKPLGFMSPEWKDAFHSAIVLGDSLGMEMGIAASPGWSETGGPWVAPADGMKKLVWSEIRVSGGKIFSGKLPAPPSITGNFQDFPITKKSSILVKDEPTPPSYYQDVAVIAYRLPETDIAMTDLKPKVTSSGGNYTLSQLTDGDLAQSEKLLRDETKGFGWIQYEFEKPITIKAITLAGTRTETSSDTATQEPDRILEASDDGIRYTKVADIETGLIGQVTTSFAPATAKYFRMVFRKSNEMISEFVLHTVTRVNHFEDKTGFTAGAGLNGYPTPITPDAINEKEVLDLSGKVDKDGNLTISLPDGNWKIIRFGYSLTGKQNHPARYEATGLEVDKLDSGAVGRYFRNYLEQYQDASGGKLGKGGIEYLLTDSYEAGQENWTPNMFAEFKKRRGYDLLAWMPALKGDVVESSGATDRFLWDWRKTLSEMVVENHYDHATEILEQYGMKRYSESHETGRVFLADGMDVKRKSAVPMSAMWTASPYTSQQSAKADIRESASVAHIYGQNLVAAESFTAIGFGPDGAWSFSPEKLKPTADLEMAHGLNQFFIHSTVHQPKDDKIPGLSLGIFGQWFNRHETWAEQAKAWTDYLARSSYLLQKGHYVADVLCYYGEDNNITGLFGNKLPPVPDGYNFDFINSDALLHLIEVRDGRLITPSGMEYSILVLDSNARTMSVPVLRKIAKLADGGAFIVGPKPTAAAGLAYDPAEFQNLVKEIWETNRPNVFTGKTMKEVFALLKIPADFQYTHSPDSTELLFVHRKVDDGDIYWINNRGNAIESIQATFRVSGKAPEIWNPVTGNTEPCSYKIGNGKTIIPLSLNQDEAMFVVFLSPAKGDELIVPKRNEQEVLTLSGPWHVSFQSERGVPQEATFEQLQSYTESNIPGIKYFSGTATYVKHFNLTKKDVRHVKEFLIDLGDLKNIAEITVNGRNIGTVWNSPYKIDIGNSLKKGKNQLEIKVANLWINRLIGDQQPDEKNKITWTSTKFYNAQSDLRPSGLMGPVKILKIEK